MTRAAADSARSLLRLHKSGSTYRVINLLRVSETLHNALGETRPKFFSNGFLNQSFILKHHLRPNEDGIFPDGRKVATKVIVPFDATNLAAGGRSVFLGEPRFEAALADTLGIQMVDGAPDFTVLKVLDSLPSFDPFLLREWLAKEGIRPDPVYFELSACNARQMEDFVASEISYLVTRSLSGSSRNEGLNRLARKMLSSNYDGELEPLRETLKMSASDFREGMFGWKGFLYYKWSAINIQSAVRRVIVEMRDYDIGRLIPQEERYMIKLAKHKIARSLIYNFNELSHAIKEYDKYYNNLAGGSKPLEFREFLRAAPGKFLRLGEIIGQIQHVVSFWDYRVNASGRRILPMEEYIDMIREFAESFSLLTP